jgi:hypothetical protein
MILLMDRRTVATQFVIAVLKGAISLGFAGLRHWLGLT